MRRLLLGYDIGSSSVKATLLDANTGKVVASEGLPKVEMPLADPKKTGPNRIRRCGGNIS